MQQPHNIIHTLTHRPYQHFHLRSIMTNLSTSVSCLLLLNQATHTLANNHDDIKSSRGLLDWFTSIFNRNPVTTEAIIGDDWASDDWASELIRKTTFNDVSADAKKVDTVDGPNTSTVAGAGEQKGQQKPPPVTGEEGAAKKTPDAGAVEHKKEQQNKPPVTGEEGAAKKTPDAGAAGAPNKPPSKNADEANTIFKKFSKNLTGKNLVAAGIVTSVLAVGGNVYHRNKKQKYQRARYQQVLALIANQGVPSTLVTENDD